MIIYYILCLNKRPTLLAVTHCPILLVFGRTIPSKSGIQKLIFSSYLASASVLLGTLQKWAHRISIFSSNSAITVLPDFSQLLSVLDFLVHS